MFLVGNILPVNKSFTEPQSKGSTFLNEYVDHLVVTLCVLQRVLTDSSEI